MQAIETREREEFLRMRAQGRIPDRSKEVQAHMRAGTGTTQS
jgi:hypothetical protein